MEHQKETKNKKQKDLTSDGLRFDSSWGLRIFSLSHARDKTKKHLSLKTSLLFYNISSSRLTSKPRLRALDPAFQGRIQTILRWLTQLASQ